MDHRASHKERDEATFLERSINGLPLSLLKLKETMARGNEESSI